jgi:RNA polymerase sigma-70 factor (ECF subfamily)
MSFAWHEIRDSLMHTSSTLSFQHTFDGLRRRREVVAPFLDPAALLDALHGTADSGDRKNRILGALVDVAHGDDAAADAALTLMLLALWPGLDAIRRRSLWRRIGTSDDIASDLLARATETIRTLDLDRVTWIAATVLRNVERDMIRARVRETNRQRLSTDVDPDDTPAAWGTPGQARLQDELHPVIGADGELVVRVAVEGLSHTEAAVELGITVAAAHKRYQRATRRLREALKKNRDPMSRSGRPSGFSLLNGDHSADQPEQGKTHAA